MNGHGEKLTRKQDAAIGALLSKPTITGAAGAVGVGEATLRRWLKEPESLAWAWTSDIRIPGAILSVC